MTLLSAEAPIGTIVTLRNLDEHSTAVKVNESGIDEWACHGWGYSVVTSDDLMEWYDDMTVVTDHPQRDYLHDVPDDPRFGQVVKLADGSHAVCMSDLCNKLIWRWVKHPIELDMTNSELAHAVEVRRRWQK